MSKKKAAAPRKVGVIIANTGTPEAPTRKAVKKYLSQFLMDPRICPMPRPVWWTLLHTDHSGQALAGLGGEVREDLRPRRVHRSSPSRPPWKVG